MARTYNFKRLSVLIVDDNAFYRGIVVRILRSFGFGEVQEAASADAAFDLLDRKFVDIVICDWEMRPVDGGAFLRRLRQTSGNPNRMIPIIMLTASSDMTTLDEAVNSGATDFLVKPISAGALLRRLIHLIENPRDYVKVGDYFGPDRRRRPGDGYEGPEKRADEKSEATPQPKKKPARALTAGDVKRALAPAKIVGGKT